MIIRADGDYHEDLKKIISHYGDEPQIIKSVEELNELSLALLKYLQGKGPSVSCGASNILDNIHEEMADVEVMLGQLRIIFDNYGKVSKNIQKKIERTKQAIKFKEGNHGTNPSEY